MSDVLDRIVADKRVHIAACKARASQRALEARLPDAPPRPFVRALEHTGLDGRLPLIAEIKKASPSKGLIRADFDPAALAKAYAAGGATCLSVLTDVPYFQGDDRYVAEARTAVDLPVLRKDFTVDPYQVVEARTLGADAILVIMAAVDDALAKELIDCAHALHMAALVEVHNREELERALPLPSKLIGINNRNLKTLKVDLATTVSLAPLIPKDRLLVAESGLYSHDDLVRMHEVGAKAFLVGESLMRQRDVTAATRELLGTVAA